MKINVLHFPTRIQVQVIDHTGNVAFCKVCKSHSELESFMDGWRAARQASLAQVKRLPWGSSMPIVAQSIESIQVGYTTMPAPCYRPPGVRA